MTTAVTYSVHGSSFNFERDRSNLADPKFVNLTAMDLTPEVVNSALEEFTDKTGIPLVIVVDSYEKVFAVESNTVTTGNNNPQTGTTTRTIAFAGIGIVAVIIAIAVIAFVVSKNKGKTKAKKEETPPWEQ